VEKARIAVVGCGFWSQFQIGGWKEFADAQVVAVVDKLLPRARQRAEQFGIPHFYENTDDLFRNHEIDAVDVITDVDTHSKLVIAAAARCKAVICQKPMAATMVDALAMLRTCQQSGVRFYVHENYRWQPQIRRVKAILDSGAIGVPFRARTAFNTAYPVFDNQPFLAQLEQFAITDQGSHQFDVIRFLFGEVRSLYCRIQRVNPAIKGEDVVTTMFEMASGAVAVSEISFASRFERESFPESLMTIEASEGSLQLCIGPEVRITTKAGTTVERVIPQRYPWQHPDYRVEPPSIVACNGNILDDLLGRGTAETTAADNFETVRLVFGAYQSARENAVVTISR